jgi:lipopolysaccharide export system permease protein
MGLPANPLRRILAAIDLASFGRLGYGPTMESVTRWAADHTALGSSRMSTIFRYITRQLFFTTIFVTVILCLIFWLAKASTLLDFIINKGLDFGFFLYMSVLILPRLLIIILPIATFATILFAYYRLNADSELVVMRAAGISPFALARPGLTVGLLVSVAMGSLTFYLLPASYRQFKDEEYMIRSKLGAIFLQEGAFNTVAPGITVFVHKRGSDQELRGIMLHDNRNREKPQTWLAERGALVSTKSGPRAVLVNGNRQQVDRQQGKFSMLFFDQTTLDVGGSPGKKDVRWREPRERFLKDLFAPRDTATDSPYYNDLIAEGHNRLVQPLLPLTCAVVTMAILLGGGYNRRGQFLDLGKAVVATVVILVLSLATRSMAAKEPLMLLAMYGNAILPLLMGLYFLLVPQHLPRSRLGGDDIAEA